MAILVIAEHDNGSLKPATLNAVTAAAALGGDIHVLVAGSGAQGAAGAAAAVSGVAKVLLADAPQYEHTLAETVAPLVVSQPYPGDGDECGEEPAAARCGVAGCGADFRHLGDCVGGYLRAADLCG